MARNILLTSLDSNEKGNTVRYFSVKSDYGYDYCDAILNVEAITKYVLSAYEIDEIITISRASSFDCEDEGMSIPLKDGSSFYSSSLDNLSAYSLFRYRIAQFIDEINIEQNDYLNLLNEQEQRKVIDVLKEYYKTCPTGEGLKKSNRYFDVLARSSDLYQDCLQTLLHGIPEAVADPERYTLWANNHLYRIFKASGKLEILPVNENVRVKFIPVSRTESREGYFDDMTGLVEAATAGSEEVNLYVALHSADAADSFMLMNMLYILDSLPACSVTVRKVFTVTPSVRELTSEIQDETSLFGITELIAAIHAFLNYGKADMFVDYWKKLGRQNDRVDRLIYAMRHIDMGLSMCNIKIIEDGIRQMKNLFRQSEDMGSAGEISHLLNIISSSIRADYGPLLEEEEIPFIDLVKWAYRHRFYQQTLTLIESRAPEALVDQGIFYYCRDEKDAARITKLLALQRLELKSYEYYIMDDINHYFLKVYDKARARNRNNKDDPYLNYANVRADSLNNTNPDLITGYSACDDKATLRDLLYAYYHIGDVRNKINHADDNSRISRKLMAEESDLCPELERLMDSVNYFISCFEKAADQVTRKHPTVIKITSSDVRTCAEKLKKKNYTRQENDRRQ